MFGNKSAWFSSSVPQACHKFWKMEDGSLADWRSADYLFSDSAMCPDTLRIFGGEDYLWNKVTVFHSLFLSACEKRQSVKSVCIGHYVLPPAPVQDEVRNVVGRYIWECEYKPPATQRSHTSFDYQKEEERRSIISESPDTPGNEDTTSSYSPVSPGLTAYVNMYNLQKYPGDLCDFQPKCYRCSSCKELCCSQNT